MPAPSECGFIQVGIFREIGMPERSPHPTPEELSAYSLGHLAGEQASIIDDHISECEPCCETIVGLSNDDTFVGLLQDAKQLRDDPAVGRTHMGTVSESESSGIPSALLAQSRYEIIGLIGKGGMGDVYQARHRMMDRTVALKVIKPEIVCKSEAVERFHREVKAAARLSHPNIVTSHDAEQADGIHYLVMEYVDGINLAHAVNERGALSIADACDYVRQAATGLQHAHEQGMVHRDIKPHNLMVTEDGTVKILDFGLASLSPSTLPKSDSVEVSTELTLAGTIMGTPDFISPEQAQDAHLADIRSDIYSLGTTLYFLLSGRPPFHDGSVMSKLKSHAQSEPEPVASLRDDVPTELVAVLKRMTAKKPEERFQTPVEVEDALQSFSQLKGPKSALHEPSSGRNQPGLDAQKSRTGDRSPKSWSLLAKALICIATISAGTILMAFVFQKAIQSNSDHKDNEVYAPLGELNSYITSMMASPHDLVFLNLGEVGTDENYVVFEPIKGGLTMRLPVYGQKPWDTRQGQDVRRIKEVCESLSLTLEETSEVRNGSIEGVNFTFTIAGNADAVAKNAARVITQTFQVDSSERCRFTYRNLPAGDATDRGEEPRLVSAEEFVREYERGDRVYFGEINNWVYLIPEQRRAENPFKRDAEVWITDLRLLPNGFAGKIRQEGASDAGRAVSDSSQFVPLASPE